MKINKKNIKIKIIVLFIASIFLSLFNINSALAADCFCTKATNNLTFAFRELVKYEAVSESDCNDICYGYAGTGQFSYAKNGSFREIVKPAQYSNPTETNGTPHFEYTLLESLPGFFEGGTSMTDFPKLVLSIYKFGIWTVGIAAMFMIVIGGIMYMGSAGNNSTANSAKGIISDALIGVATALAAYLFLYVINPDLTRINLDFTPVMTSEKYNGTFGYASGGGVCKPAEDGPCSIENLKNTCFGSNAEVASIVCNYESNGRVNNASLTDIGADKNVFSWGLFQINLTFHNLNGLNCESAFSGKNYKSTVINFPLYEQCKAAANTAMININYACKISNNGRNLSPWDNTRKACHL